MALLQLVERNPRVRPEWHLLKLFGMSIFHDDFSGFGA
jgi:hypothetical protein